MRFTVIGPGRLTRQGALMFGYGSIVAGAWLLHEAYERRGHTRPFFARFLPS